ncbi:hypothetical protein AYI70_g9247, partial [Smittium culicis]
MSLVNYSDSDSDTNSDSPQIEDVSKPISPANPKVTSLS